MEEKMPDKIDLPDKYKKLYSRITGDNDTEVLELCFTTQLRTVPIQIYGDPASVPKPKENPENPEDEESFKIPEDIIDVCAGRAVYAACIIYKNMKKSGNDEDADTDQFLSSFSAGGVSMSFSSAESSAGESTDTEDFEELKQILWEIPRELYRKYRTNKNCYWRV
jgi:hypothetical protein